MSCLWWGLHDGRGMGRWVHVSSIPRCRQGHAIGKRPQLLPTLPTSSRATVCSHTSSKLTHSIEKFPCKPMFLLITMVVLLTAVYLVIGIRLIPSNIAHITLLTTLWVFLIWFLNLWLGQIIMKPVPLPACLPLSICGVPPANLFLCLVMLAAPVTCVSRPTRYWAVLEKPVGLMN